MRSDVLQMQDLALSPFSLRAFVAAAEQRKVSLRGHGVVAKKIAMTEHQYRAMTKEAEAMGLLRFTSAHVGPDKFLELEIVVLKGKSA